MRGGRCAMMTWKELGRLVRNEKSSKSVRQPNLYFPLSPSLSTNFFHGVHIEFFDSQWPFVPLNTPHSSPIAHTTFNTPVSPRRAPPKQYGQHFLLLVFFVRQEADEQDLKVCSSGQAAERVEARCPFPNRTQANFSSS